MSHSGRESAVEWDVVIAGAGPAGSLTAIRTARFGRRVLLLDRALFPRYKVCGCCLSSAAVRVLEDFGLGEIPRNLGASKLERLELEVFGERGVVSLPGGYAVSRTAFDMALVNAAIESGAIFLSGVSAQLDDSQGRFCRIRLREGGSERIVRARIAVCADGLHGTFLTKQPHLKSRVRVDSRIGLAAVCPWRESAPVPGTIRMAIGEGGYVGQVRLEDGSLNIAAAINHRALQEERPAGIVSEILRQAGADPINGLESLAWRGTPLLTRTRPRLSERRLFLVGDAAGYEEPFTGEGMAWSLSGAKLLAPLIEESVETWRDDLSPQWNQLFRRHIRRRQWICRLIRRGLRRRQLCRVMIATLKLDSRWVYPIVASLNRPFAQIT